MAGLTLSKLEKKFGKVDVIRGVDLDIADGEFVVFVGPSGCGKSTLLRVLADIIPLSQGSVTVFGDTPAAARKRRQVSFVFQQSVLMPWAKVIDNVRLPLEVGGFEPATHEHMDPNEALRLVGLQDFANALPSELSGGMRQRVSIARALVTRPRILLMDEPFGALDELVRDALNVELLDIWRKSGTTILFVTHSLQEAAFLSQRVVALSRRPARISGIVDIDLPARREIELKDSARLGAYAAQLRRLLEEN